VLKILTDIIDDIGACVLFVKEVVRTALTTPCTFESVCEQIWKVTMQSMSTTALAGFFVGAIMTVQFTMQINAFGAIGYLGGLASSATVREVGPLLIAFLLSGKVGAFTSAELGTMQVTEQIDAIRCLGANPMQEIILPRYIGIIISSFFLLAIGFTPLQTIRPIVSGPTSPMIGHPSIQCTGKRLAGRPSQSPLP
jgi:phospholipid/cholesterol/gamma-HCH transport system permease protein